MIERIKNICITPKTEWPVIAEESVNTASLLTSYVLPLALIGAVAGFIGGSLIGHSIPFAGITYRTPVITGLGLAVFTVVMAVVGVFILSLIIDALAPSFSGQKNGTQALKVAVYSYTPAWLAGIFQIIPMMGLLGILAGFYGLYLLYLGLPRLMKCPEDKALGYTAVVVICAIVLAVIMSVITGVIIGAGSMATGAMHGAMRGGDSGAEVSYDKDSAMGKLAAMGKKMEESGKAMEAAQKSGDENAQMAAAAAAMGTLFSGGKKIDPLSIEQLKPFVPDTFAGLAKKSSSTDRSGVAGLMVAKAEANYGDDAGKKNVALEISDTGGASGMLGLASWAMMEGEKDDKYSTESTRKIDGRMVHEKAAKQAGGSNEFSIVLGERFVVSANGRGVDIGQLKAAVNSLDLKKLEAMKDVGVQK